MKRPALEAELRVWDRSDAAVYAKAYFEMYIPIAFALGL